MLNSIIRFSVRNKLVIGLFIAVLIGWGIYSVSRLSIDALPDITSNQVQVITTSPTLAAPEVERLVTFPVEQSTANIPGLKEMRSISRFGLSVVTIVFTDDTDIYWARQQVSERLNHIKEMIPASAGRPELAPVTTGLGEIFQYIVRPANGYEGKYDLTELRSIQDWIIRRQLLGTPGVADISSFGGRLKQYEVAIIPNKLKSLGVTIHDVFTALEKNNQNSGGAYIEKGPNALFIRTEGLVSSIDDIKQVFVTHTSQGIPVYIQDVADVRIGHAVRYGAMTYKDKGEVAGAVVLMLKGANASAVIDHVKERIEEIKKTLPEGVVLEPFYDRTKVVNNAISTVLKNLLEGALIVLFVLVLFLGNWRAGFIVASVIPLSMLFAFGMMNVFGVSGNLMSLGALDFGLIVDGAVIIVEAVMHRLSRSSIMAGVNRISQPQMNTEVEESAGKMLNAAIFGQIIILIVYLPVLTLSGIEGKMFRPMAQTVAFALIGAFLLSFTYVPMITALVLSKKIKRKESFSDRMMKWLQGMYRKILQKALAVPKLVVATALLMLAVAVWILSTLGGEFIPELEEGDFAVDGRILTGSSLTQSVKTSQQAAAILQQQFPEVQKIVTRIGSSEIPTDPMPIEMTDIIIILKPKKEWTSAKSYDELAGKMSKALEDIPGLNTGFQFPIQMRFNELISGARQDVVCKIFGENLDSLAGYAQKLGTIAGSIDGIADTYVETITGLPQIVVKYNRAAMAHYRLNIADVNQVIRTAFAGESAGLVYENERRYDLVVRMQEDIRQDITDVSDLLIPTPAGIQLPLSQVAEVTIQEGPAQIQRENAQRRVIVGFNVRGRDVQSVVKELDEKISRRLKLPAGYSVAYGGQFQNLVEATNRLAIAVPVALLLIFILLFFAFRSIKLVFLVYSAIPLSAIGGILFLWLRDMPFSISAGIGFIALFGVAVLNGIVLMAEFNHLKKQGMQDIQQIVMEGTATRLRPVLMTASVASLGFLPMAISTSAGAEVQRPLATVVIGGLVTATILTLLVLPVIYVWLEKRKGSGKKKISRVTAMIVLLMAATTVNGQTITGKKVTLDTMLQQAARQNLSLQNLQQESVYWKQLQESVFHPGKTQLGVEYGNVNSAFNDTRFYISQSFDMPIVYKRQRQLYEAQQKNAGALTAVKQQELEREIKQVFYNMADLLERAQLLNKLDSVYSRFLYMAELRLQTGETNMLEKATAETQVQQLKLQQLQINADMLIYQQRLQWLLNTGELLLPEYNSLRKNTAWLADTSFVTGHPELQYRQQQVQVAEAKTAIERSQLSPDITLGYSNMSIVGYHSTDGVTQKYYDAGDRFNIYQLTLGLPLFNKATKTRVKAAQFNETIARKQEAATRQYLQNRLQQLVEEVKKYNEQVNYYEQTGLQQADLLMNNANISFREGDISYLEWSLHLKNAVSIRLNYLEAVRLVNQAAIELEYLTRK